MESLERENGLDPLSSSLYPGMNAQCSLEGSDQQTVQPGAVQREKAFIDTEMGLGGLMGHMSAHEVWGTFLTH